MERQLDAYCEHLRSERQVSPHTLEAYRRDLNKVLAHCNKQGIGDWASLDIQRLRHLIARLHSQGQSSRSLARLLSEDKSVSGSLREHELDFLFGEEQRKQIGSTAVVTLGGLQGVLAIASRDPQHYKSSVGTLFLGYIAEVMGRVLPRVNTTLRSVR